jgi:hypothetical protein
MGPVALDGFTRTTAALLWTDTAGIVGIRCPAPASTASLPSSLVPRGAHPAQSTATDNLTHDAACTTAQLTHDAGASLRFH